VKLHDGHTVRRLHECDRIRMFFEPCLARFVFHPAAAMPAEYELAAEVLVIHADQAARGATRDLRKIRHGIGIGAELPFLVRHRARVQPCGVGETARIEIGRAGDKAVTPAGDDVVAIAVGDGECVDILRRDTVEAARAAGRFAGCGGRRRTRGEPDRGGGSGNYGAA